MPDEALKNQADQKPPVRAPLLQTDHQILQAVNGIQYGSVEIIIQDGRVVQIERKEKVRLDNEGFPRQARRIADQTTGGLQYQPRRADRTPGGLAEYLNKACKQNDG